MKLSSTPVERIDKSGGNWGGMREHQDLDFRRHIGELEEYVGK
jgi:hypothetical protein